MCKRKSSFFLLLTAYFKASVLIKARVNLLILERRYSVQKATQDQPNGAYSSYYIANHLTVFVSPLRQDSNASEGNPLRGPHNVPTTHLILYDVNT